MSDVRPDPNRDRNDPMVPEYWQLGEDVQDAIRHAGYEAPNVEGIAVDLHDLLQAADRIRVELAPTLTSAATREGIEALEVELDHIGWHVAEALKYLRAARESL